MSIEKPRRTRDASTEARPARDDGHPPRVAIKFGALTDPGKVPRQNEDHFLVARLSKSIARAQDQPAGRRQYTVPGGRTAT